MAADRCPSLTLRVSFQNALEHRIAKGHPGISASGHPPSTVAATATRMIRLSDTSTYRTG